MRRSGGRIQIGWGVHLAGFRLRNIRLRDIFDTALKGTANYSVTALDIHTEDHATTWLTWILLLFLPKATVEFDVVAVLPATREAVH